MKLPENITAEFVIYTVMCVANNAREVATLNPDSCCCEAVAEAIEELVDSLTMANLDSEHDPT